MCWRVGGKFLIYPIPHFSYSLPCFPLLSRTYQPPGPILARTSFPSPGTEFRARARADYELPLPVNCSAYQEESL